MNASGSAKLPQIVLFGDSLTEWGFDSDTQGFGWYLEEWYKGKAEIVNEGTLICLVNPSINITKLMDAT
jgi:lysophospholipase L1-like esterase